MVLSERLLRAASWRPWASSMALQNTLDAGFASIVKIVA